MEPSQEGNIIPCSAGPLRLSPRHTERRQLLGHDGPLPGLEQIHSEWQSGYAANEHYPFYRRRQLRGCACDVGGDLGGHRSLASQGLSLQPWPAEVAVVLVRGCRDLAVAGPGPLCSVLQAVLLATLRFHDS